MPTLANHPLGSYVKLLLIGDSGTGKTGSLASLAKDGYRLRILDLDNGLDSLVAVLRNEAPDRLSQVDFETRRDHFSITKQGARVLKPEAYIESLKLLTEWSDGSTPAGWGPDTVLVVDSLTALGDAAFQWAKGMNPTSKDPRQWYFAAQQSIRDMLALLTSDAMETNVVLIAHINYNEVVDANGNLIEKKGYPTSIGSALGPQIARYFNTMLVAETTGSGNALKRHIRAVTNGIIDAKAPITLPSGRVDLSTGLATIFSKLKGKS